MFDIGLFINEIINSFDWSYMLVVNLITYLVIQAINEKTKKKKSLKKLTKMLITIVIGVLIAIANYFLKENTDLLKLFYSFVLSMISFDYIFKPILKKIKLDYKIFDNSSNNKEE